uniref:Cytochrome P450 n=1 Tax=Timema monikensis TaxID=170555 RepID=A0A7R9E876_9NEOP|nr:unnamed protein product [Timema monikensis]
MGKSIIISPTRLGSSNNNTSGHMNNTRTTANAELKPRLAARDHHPAKCHHNNNNENRVENDGICQALPEESKTTHCPLFLDHCDLQPCASSVPYVATWNYDYFSKRNIPYSRPVPFLGSMAPQLFGRKSNADVVWELYKKYKGHRLSGFFQFNKPITFINDPELIKMIAVKDFDHFVDHETLVPSEVDPLFGGNLFFLKGQRWRDMRNALTPTFTSSKMRSMFILLNQVGQQMAEYLQDLHKTHGKDVHTMEMKDFFTRFASDVIATAAFGIQVNSMKDPTNEFYKAGKQLANFEGLQKLIFLGYLFCSKLMTNPLFGKRAKRLLQKLDLTDEDIVAQAMVFFLAGFDTASTLLCYTAHLLAVNEDSQVQLQSEIDDMLRETEENISYEAIQAMKYLDMVISESLRIFPPVDNVDRVCVKPYSIPAKGNQPGTTFQLDDIALIPILGLHRDPEFFPEPDRFDPERFSEENKSSIKPFTYMPFGIGQRSCIGNRFALMEAKVALVYLLSKFSLRVVDKTAVKIEFSANNLTPTPKGGFWPSELKMAALFD